MSSQVDNSECSLAALVVRGEVAGVVRGLFGLWVEVLVLWWGGVGRDGKGGCERWYGGRGREAYLLSMIGVRGSFDCFERMGW